MKSTKLIDVIPTPTSALVHYHTHMLWLELRATIEREGGAPWPELIEKRMEVLARGIEKILTNKVKRTKNQTTYEH